MAAAAPKAAAAAPKSSSVSTAAAAAAAVAPSAGPLGSATAAGVATGASPFRLLQCALCREELSDPRYLPCSHTFCAACLEAYVDESTDQDRFVCPQCRQWLRDVDGESPPRNEFIAALLLAKAAARPVLCRPCGQCRAPHSLAVLECADCRAEVCVDCAAEHGSATAAVGAQRAHRTAPLRELSVFVAEQRLACERHGRAIEFCCRQCGDRARCGGDCARACEQRRHELRSLESAADEARRQLVAALLGRAQQQQQRRRSSSASASPSPSSAAAAESRSRFLQTVDRVRAEVEERYRKFVEALSLLRDHALAELEQARVECAAAVANGAAVAACGVAAASYGQRLLELGRPADVACLAGAVAEQLRRSAAAASGGGGATPIAYPDVQLVYDKRKDVLESLRALFGGTYVRAAPTAPHDAATSPLADDEERRTAAEADGADETDERRTLVGAAPPPSLASFVAAAAGPSGRPPRLVCEIEVPHHVNGIAATGERACVLLATKGVRVFNMAPRALPPPPATAAATAAAAVVAATPGIVVSDEDGSQVRSLTTLRTVAGREVFDTGGDEVRSFCVKTRFLHAALLSSGFIVTTNDTKKSLTVYTPNGLVAAECHVPKSKGPWGVAVASGDRIVLADCDARRVTVHDAGGQLLAAIDKDPATGKDYFGYPCFVAARDSTIVVSDVNRHRVLAFDAGSGRALWRYGSRGSAPAGELYRPEGVCVDELGNVYVAENGNGRITVLSLSQGAFRRTLLSSEHGLCEPFSVAVNRHGELLVLERAISSPRKPMKIKLYSLLSAAGD